MRVGRFLAFLALLLFGLVGLLLIVCGGGFLVATLGSGGFRGVVWVIALASLASGIVVLLVVGKMIKVLSQDDTHEPPRRE